MREEDPVLWWRRLWGPLIASSALVFLGTGVAHAAEPGVPVPPGELITDTANGEVTDADVDLVVKVRLAGLWEIPAGEMAQKKSKNPKIQKIGKEIAAQHEVLDKLDRAAAKKLDIKLPNQPNKDQQGWLAEMRDAEGEDFDQIYIDRLRAAHGKIFPAIATIRASTRNDTVRKLAQQANQFVATHMTLLESSSIVDFQALPTAPNPSAAASTPAASKAGGTALNEVAQTQSLTTNRNLIIAVLVAVVAVGAFVTWRTMGSSPRRPSRRRYRY
jgi:putative membrane protein